MATTVISQTGLSPVRGFTAGVLGRWLPPAGRQILGVPLALKMAGANAVVLVTAIVLGLAHDGLGSGDIPLLAGALAFSFLISTVLVFLALEPVRALERAARRILSGQLDARVQVSALADRDVRRVAGVLNSLLESLTGERERIREMAVRMVSAHDDERARVARELEDSTAQGIAALVYEIRAELDRTGDEETKRRLERLHGLALRNLEELQSITSVVHPRVLTDLGILPALQWLARGVRKRHNIAITVDSDAPAPRLRPVFGAALFALARDAIESAAKRDGTKSVRIFLSVDDRRVQLLVEDDGAVMTPGGRAELESELRHRVGLVEGWVAIEKSVRGGTAVIAVVPMSVI